MRLLPLAFLILGGCTLGVAATPFVSGPWCGNVTATSASAAIHVAPSGTAVRWVLSESSALTSAIYSPVQTAQSANGNVVKLSVQGLQPATKYYYGFEVGGELRTEAMSRGSFRTFPSGAASFKIAFGACGDYRKEDQSAYEAILAENPLLFLNTGDLHYSDTSSTNAADYRANYDGVLNQPFQAALYRSVPMAYVWDDHDFCGNDSDGNSPGRDTARRVYDQVVPHYPFGATDGTIGQAFTVGRVRVIVTDLRSASSDRLAAETSAKTHMGEAQKIWFKQELINARDANFPLILWVSPTPWIGTAGTGDDDWSMYAAERREIANFIKANRIKNVTLLCGDMHGLAYDDGQNSDYADGGGAPLVVLHAAALTSPGSVKGGPYSGGAIPGSQQYGVLEITDNGGSTVKCTFTGKHSRDGTKLSYTFSGLTPLSVASLANFAASGESAFTNISSRDRITAADGVTIVGFVIGGSVPRTVLIRAVGPSLKPLGVTDAISDPIFSVFRGKAMVASNDNWADGNASQLSTVCARVGAFAFASTSSKDAAALVTVNPGVYSVVARSGDGAMGTVMVEVYDVP